MEIVMNIAEVKKKKYRWKVSMDMIQTIFFPFENFLLPQKLPFVL